MAATKSSRASRSAKSRNRTDLETAEALLVVAARVTGVLAAAAGGATLRKATLKRIVDRATEAIEAAITRKLTPSQAERIVVMCSMLITKELFPPGSNAGWDWCRANNVMYLEELAEWTRDEVAVRASGMVLSQLEHVLSSEGMWWKE